MLVWKLWFASRLRIYEYGLWLGYHDRNYYQQHSDITVTRKSAAINNHVNNYPNEIVALIYYESIVNNRPKNCWVDWGSVVLLLVLLDWNLALNSDAARSYKCSKTSMTRTPMARLPWLIRTRFLSRKEILPILVAQQNRCCMICFILS